ncbi:phosphoinositide 3-kinase regulatory subunit 4 [Niveomyces insectorum RCEF 264]|uniref:Phosphoinositide 3-kinase regulatory subunit 4 n=1 Tax=Niveomyces insectorum RCEF 264 TaxID=1081102 RepID=A0A167XPG8_9HYPO|nr:phosphoinositide 3-kinase regulatory subunit 4 [Niveomyces insectorum RCEF 264]
MADLIVVDPNLPRADRMVLESLIRDIREERDYEDEMVDGEHDEKNEKKKTGEELAMSNGRPAAGKPIPGPDAALLATLDALNDPASGAFEPTVFTSIDLLDLRQAVATARKAAAVAAVAADTGSGSGHGDADMDMDIAAKTKSTLWAQATGGLYAGLQRFLLEPYVRLVRRHVVRYETDVVFATHLLLYFATVVPSAATLLLVRFTWLHGLLHAVAVLGGCMGSYTIMMHQHIHQGGVLRRDRWWTAAVDRLFPYLLDPLFGHTWNSYYYHHVKHHHVEGNGPDDLSSTMWYRRDSLRDFGRYLGRFLLLAWFDLPRYFARTRRYGSALRAGFWELASYGLLGGSCYLGGSSRSPYALAVHVTDVRAAVCVFVIPFVVMRVGLMLGNWGQHAFVDPDAPASDFRSSITLLDVASNRVCFNDGYHTSHHLNPRRHWREHPRAFVAQKRTYAAEQGLVFFGVDYLMISLRLLLFQDYAYLARRLVPLGPAQRRLTLDERAALLRRLTAPFSAADVARTFPKSRAAAAWRRKQGLPAA